MLGCGREGRSRLHPQASLCSGVSPEQQTHTSGPPARAHLRLQKQRWQSRIKGTVTTKFVKLCFPYGVRSKLVRNKVLPEFFSFNVHLLMFNTPFWGRPDFGCPARHASEHVLHVLSRMSAALLLALFIVAFKGQSGVRFSDFCILSAPV